MPEAETMRRVAEQYDDAEQQETAATFGMWVFLATEVLFFGALFLAFGVYRTLYAETFKQAGMHMKLMIGCLNTAILLAGSFAAAAALHAVQTDKRRLGALLLAATAALGAAFLGFKFYEYYSHWQEQLVPGPGFQLAVDRPWGAQLFFFLYFFMTGVHALHLSIGIGAAATLSVRAWRGAFGPRYHTPVHLFGLYWHFVDIVWVFLFPLVYLVNRVH